MPTKLVLTVIGADRPGLVSAIAGVVHEHGGSWQGSHMARLAGRFAGVLQIEVPESRAAEMTAALGADAGPGLHVVVETGLDDAPAADSGTTVVLNIVTGDRPGIVHEVADAIAAAGANVESLETECVMAPHCGGGLFHANARVSVPDASNLDALRHALEGVGDDLILDIETDEQAHAAESTASA